MLSLTQIIGIIIAISLTAMLLIIGYQIVLILIEIKNILRKTNHIVTDANKISRSISEPIVTFSGFLTGLKDGANIIKMFTETKSNSEKKKSS